MAETGFDGSVRINTKIDEKGFNAGMKKVTASADSSLRTLLTGTISKLGTMLTSIAKSIALIGGAIIGAAIGFVAFGTSLIRNMKEGLDQTSAYYKLITRLEEQFNRVKGALLALFGTLLQAAMPVIIQVTNWLVRMIELINQVVAAFLGQRTVMRYVGNTADDASKNTRKLAKETEKTKKAAEGALAAFDMINVLQKKTADDAAATNPELDRPESSFGLNFEEVPINQGIIDKVEEFRQKLQAIWDAAVRAWGIIKMVLQDAWNALVETWGKLVQWFKPIWEAIGPTVIALWENIKNTFRRAAINFLETFLIIKENIQRIFRGIGDFIAGIITGDWARAWEGLKNIVGGVFGVIVALIRYALNTMIILAQGAWNTLKIIWGALSGWFQSHVINPLVGAFVRVWDFLRTGFANAMVWIQNIWRTGFDNLVGFIRSPINGVIGLLNGLLRGITTTINRVADAINSIHIDIPALPFFGFPGVQLSPQMPHINAGAIPYLATGAVIPPNSQFLAVLGDQRGGRNLEAPEGLIRQIIQEEIGNIRADIQIEFVGNLSALARELRPEIVRENVRIGNNLARNTT